MNKEYRQEIGRILYMMAEAFRDTASEALLDAWVAVLDSEKITVAEAQVAAVLVMKSREYNKLPPPGVFLELIRPIPRPKDLAEAQADKVLEAVRKMGPYQQPTFKDPITAELMDRRWPWFDFASNLESEQVKWWRKEFADAYCDLFRTGGYPLLQVAEVKALNEGKA